MLGDFDAHLLLTLTKPFTTIAFYCRKWDLELQNYMIKEDFGKDTFKLTFLNDKFEFVEIQSDLFKINGRCRTRTQISLIMYAHLIVCYLYLLL